MRSVSDNSATAPISALTYAFSVWSDRGLQADDSEARIIAGRAMRRTRVNQIDTPKGDAMPYRHASSQHLARSPKLEARRR